MLITCHLVVQERDWDAGSDDSEDACTTPYHALLDQVALTKQPSLAPGLLSTIEKGMHYKQCLQRIPVCTDLLLVNATCRVQHMPCLLACGSNQTNMITLSRAQLGPDITNNRMLNRA